MKRISVTVIANKRELDMIIEAKREISCEILISQWSENPVEYKVELPMKLYDYMNDGRMTVFIN